MAEQANKSKGLETSFFMTEIPMNMEKQQVVDKLKELFKEELALEEGVEYTITVGNFLKA